MTAYEHGVPCWVDLGTPDVDASVAFYSGLFGWTATSSAYDAGGYRMFVLGDKVVAGVGPQQAPGPPSWTTYFSVSSCDDVAGAVRDAGGTVMLDPLDVFDAGRMAVCADSQGAAFSLWEGRSLPGAQLVNEPGAFCWNELYTRDPSNSLTFYAEVLGLGSMMTDAYTELLLDGRSVAGMVYMDHDRFPPEVPSHWITYVAVDDCDAALARAEELGAVDVGDPVDAPVGRYGMVTDPQGAIVSVIALAS